MLRSSPMNAYFRYLEYRSKDEKLIINLETWVLDCERIFFAEELVRSKKLEKLPLEKHSMISTAIDNIPKYPLKKQTIYDPSFGKKLFIYYQNKGEGSMSHSFDLENLSSTATEIDLTTDSIFSLSKTDQIREKIKVLEKKKNFDPMFGENKIKSVKRADSFQKKIYLLTDNFGVICITLIREYSRLNHRNSVIFSAEKIPEGVTGFLLSKDNVYTVDELESIGPVRKKNKIKCQTTVEQSSEMKDILRKKRLDIRTRIRKLDYSLLGDPEE